DRGLAARSRALDEHVDLAHPVLHGTARGGLGGHLRGIRGRLARALESDLARAGPGDHRTVGVGDGDDRVAEGALDVSLPVGHVLLVLAAHLPGAGRATALGGHAVSPDGGSRYGLLAGLLLAGHGALGALAGARVGLGALAAHREAAAVTQALVAADLDLAADVGRDLTAQVTLEAVVALEVVTQLHQLLVRQVLHPGVGAHARRL